MGFFFCSPAGSHITGGTLWSSVGGCMPYARTSLGTLPTGGIRPFSAKFSPGRPGTPGHSETPFGGGGGASQLQPDNPPPTPPRPQGGASGRASSPGWCRCGSGRAASTSRGSTCRCPWRPTRPWCERCLLFPFFWPPKPPLQAQPPDFWASSHISSHVFKAGQVDLIKSI